MTKVPPTHPPTYTCHYTPPKIPAPLHSKPRHSQKVTLALHLQPRLKVYLYRVATTEGDPAAHEEEVRFPDRTGRTVDGLPWGSGWGGAAPHPDPPAPLSHGNPLEHYRHCCSRSINAYHLTMPNMDECPCGTGLNRPLNTFFNNAHPTMLSNARHDCKSYALPKLSGKNYGSAVKKIPEGFKQNG